MVKRKVEQKFKGICEQIWILIPKNGVKFISFTQIYTPKTNVLKIQGVVAEKFRGRT